MDYFGGISLNKHLMIKDIQPEYRPDEKFLRFGPKALTGAELLAIILRTGSSEEHSVELAGRILHSDLSGTENVLNILDLGIKDLMSIKGVGRVKALQVKAVAELSGRIHSESTRHSLVFTEPESVASHYMESLRHLKKEVVLMLALNSACALIKECLISQGTVNLSLFSPREIFLEAFNCEAVNIILLHNHPSGSPVPSSADISGTRQVAEAGGIIGINLLDHIIIGDNVYCSMKEEGYIK